MSNGSLEDRSRSTFRSVPASSGARGAVKEPSLGRTTRRWLYILHRWIGIVTCLFFAIWFASGLVMIYVPYPSLSLGEKLAGSAPIDWATVDVPPPTSAEGPPLGLDLEMRDGVPVWRVQYWDGARETEKAALGTMLWDVDAPYARRVSRAFSGAAPEAVEKIERDQWTVAGGFDRHRPLWKVSVADGKGTQLYVSSSTGGVVLSTTQSERFWNWLGSVPHWIYFTSIRTENEVWRQVVMWVSGPCIAVGVTGIWIGILRTRVGKRRFKGGRMTPYHGWMLWHHVAGLAGGLFLLTWIFSGWLSVDPGHLFESPGPAEGVEHHYSASAPMPAVDLRKLEQLGEGARLARFTVHAGLPMVTLYDAKGERRMLSLPGLAPAPSNEAKIAAAARGLVPDGRIVDTALLTEPDSYYYGIGEKPRLPVIRLKFDDPGQTWLYLDPVSGEILQGVDTRRRVYRWLYDFLHKWDLSVLTLNRPIWDIWLWSFSIFGLVTSVSGIWIGWKRLFHQRRV